MAKPRTPAKTTKARDGWPRYYKSLYNDFAARLDRHEKMLSEKQAPPVAKPAGVVTWTKVYGGVFRYVDGKCVQAWDTGGLRCDYTTQPARISSETDITYAEALKNPGVMRDYPPPPHIGDNDSRTGPDEVKPIAPDLEAMAREWAESYIIVYGNNDDTRISIGKLSCPNRRQEFNIGKYVDREAVRVLAQENLVSYLLAFSRHAESERVRQLEARVAELIKGGRNAMRMLRESENDVAALKTKLSTAKEAGK